MSAGNPGIAAKDTKEETKSEREERILKEFIRGTTSIGFKVRSYIFFVFMVILLALFLPLLLYPILGITSIMCTDCGRGS